MSFFFLKSARGDDFEVRGEKLTPLSFASLYSSFAKKKKRFYLFVNVGSLLAVTVVVWIQDAVSWSVGFAVPAAAMLCATVVFVAGASKYRHVTPTESPMARVVNVLSAAARNARQQRREAKKAAAAERSASSPSLRRRGGGGGGGSASAAAAAAVAAAAASPSSLSSPLLQDASYRSVGGSSLRGGNAFSAGLGGGGGYDGPVNLPPGAPIHPSSLSPAPSAAIPCPSSYQWLSFAEMGDESGSGNGSGDDGRLPLGSSSAGAGGAASSSAGAGGAASSSAGGGGFAGFTARQVEEVRMVVRMMPIFWTTAFYWAIYAQMGSFFVEQGQFMDRRISLFSPFPSPSPSASSGGGGGGGGGGSGASGGGLPGAAGGAGGHSHRVGGRPFEVPAASLALFNTVAIIALVPLYDRGLLPLLRACGKRGPTLLQRIGWGLVVCALAMAAAAGVEQARLAKVAAGDIVDDGGRHRGGDVAALSVFWQVPQYLLVGASEVLASIGQLEFFYDQAPDVMRSCSMALQLLSVAVGSYLSGALVAAVGAGTAALGLGKDGRGESLSFFLSFSFFSFRALEVEEGVESCPKRKTQNALTSIFPSLSRALSLSPSLANPFLLSFQKKTREKKRLASLRSERRAARSLLLVHGGALRREHCPFSRGGFQLPVQGRAAWAQEEGCCARRGGGGGRIRRRTTSGGGRGDAAAAPAWPRAADGGSGHHSRRRRAPRALWGGGRELAFGLGVREVSHVRPSFAGAARAVQVEEEERERERKEKFGFRFVFSFLLFRVQFVLSHSFSPCFHQS